jgi:hypothetical protein
MLYVIPVLKGLSKETLREIENNSLIYFLGLKA